MGQEEATREERKHGRNHHLSSIYCQQVMKLVAAPHALGAHRPQMGGMCLAGVMRCPSCCMLEHAAGAGSPREQGQVDVWVSRKPGGRWWCAFPSLVAWLAALWGVS
jgi:hypothetical protein